ncbi:MAG TPA: GH25 family lysozyme, partial [Cellulomonadaceae bacterium]|nr:GH25 family lysozyme [Cellulomonadaceae bacterium]
MPDVVIADVSEFQQVIDWAAYGASVPGVIIRAHNGTRPDLYWVANRDGARAHVGWRGFYQYLPASIDPVVAARAFQATTGPLLPGEVAILDLEEGSGDQRARRQAWLDTLTDPVEWTYSGLA